MLCPINYVSFKHSKCFIANSLTLRDKHNEYSMCNLHIINLIHRESSRDIILHLGSSQPSYTSPVFLIPNRRIMEIPFSSSQEAMQDIP